LPKTRHGQPILKHHLRYAALALVAVLGSCSSDGSRPSDIDDACVIKEEKPRWYAATRAAEARWGVPPHVLLATIYYESKFRADARTRREYLFGFIPAGRESSAFGFSQALDATWDWYRDETGRRGADRDDFSDSVDFMGWYMDQSFQRNGIAKDDAYNQYLAYHEGHTGYARGNHRNNSFVRNYAALVQDKADTYESQLARCT
jgi:hypothetical protein